MTKKLLSLSLIMLLQYAFPATVLAQKSIEECEKTFENPKKTSRCFDELIVKLDRELDTWINNHVFNLEEKSQTTGRLSALKIFKKSQNDFVTFRDNDCRWQYLAVSTDANADLAYKKCYIVVTQSRIIELSKVP